MKDFRILYSDNGTLTDYTTNLDNYHGGTHSFSFVASEDAIYIGSRLPFNHIYLKLGSTVNAETSSMSISYWDSIDWRSAVEVIDETAVSGASLAQSGFVSWVPDKDYGWIREDTNYGGIEITGLTSVEIYDLYWLRINFSADLTADVTLSWAGQKFSDDDDLGTEYADLVRTSVLSAYESGKTDWEEQHIAAAKIIIQDIKKRGLIYDKQQILKWDEFTPAAVSQVAKIIYGGLGNDYLDARSLAVKDYAERIGNVLPTIDKDRNARENTYDRITQGRLYR